MGWARLGGVDGAAWPHSTATCSAWLHLGGFGQVSSRACSCRARPRPLPLPVPCMLTRSRSALHLGHHLGCRHPGARGARRACAHSRRRLSASSLSAWRGNLCTAGLRRNRVDLQNSWGPGSSTPKTHTTLRVDTETAYECTHSAHRQGVSRHSDAFRCNVSTRTYTRHTWSQALMDVDGHTHPAPQGSGMARGLSRGAGAAGRPQRAGCSPCWPSGSAHGRQSCLPLSNTGWAPPLWGQTERKRRLSMRRGL